MTVRALVRIASLADALVATHGTALEMAGRQPNIAPELLAIVELSVEDLTNQHRGNSRSDALDFDEVLNVDGFQNPETDGVIEFAW